MTFAKEQHDNVTKHLHGESTEKREPMRVEFEIKLDSVKEWRYAWKNTLELFGKKVRVTVEEII